MAQSKTVTVAQAQAYLKDLGYVNPDGQEIQGAMKDLSSNPEALAKYASVEDKKDATPSTGIPYMPNWGAYGVTPDVWAKLNATQQAQVAIVMNGALNNYAQSASSLSVPDALKSALNDPAIISKYSDALNMDKAELQSTLVDTQTALSNTAQQQKIQFETDRKNLAETNAAAGTAYSGFREQAQKNLTDTESGIVTSTRVKAQQIADKARQAFEAKYGTSATPSFSLKYSNPGSRIDASGRFNPSGASDDTLNGSTVGNIIGSDTVSKSADITNLALKNIESSSPVPITPIK